MACRLAGVPSAGAPAGTGQLLRALFVAPAGDPGRRADADPAPRSPRPLLRAPGAAPGECLRDPTAARGASPPAPPGAPVRADPGAARPAAAALARTTARLAPGAAAGTRPPPGASATA